MNAVQKAVQLIGLQELARRCGVSYQAVQKWQRLRIPAERCQAVQDATNGQVTRAELRPDLFAQSEQLHDG